MTTSSVLLVVAIAAFVLWTIRYGGALPMPFGARSCQGKAWRRSFTESFAFRDREKLKLNPNDQLLDIYRALYPHKWQADALEFEILNENIEAKYGISFNKLWRDGLTLGQLFTSLRAASK
jgi:propanediol dehydratase small subunit